MAQRGRKTSGLWSLEAYRRQTSKIVLIAQAVRAFAGMGSKQRPAQTRSPDWWWPPKIVGLGASVLYELVVGAGDSDSLITWLVLATGLLALAAFALPIQWGQGLHLIEEQASPAAAGREQARMSRRRRRLATASWTLLTLITLVLAIPLVFWDPGSLPEDRMRTVTRAWIALVMAWGIPTLVLAVQLWTQRKTLKAVALARTAAQERPRHARGARTHEDRARADEQTAVHDGQAGQRLGAVEESEPGPPVARSPLFRYRRGHRQLTIWPDGTLEEDAGERTRRVLLVDAQAVSVDYDGEPVIVGRDKAFAPRTQITVRDRSGEETMVWVRWGMPQSVIAQFQQIAGGFGATIVDLLPPPASPNPGIRPSWRTRLAGLGTWVSGVAAFIGSIVFVEFITGSDVASDETDPRLWGRGVRVQLPDRQRASDPAGPSDVLWPPRAGPGWPHRGGLDPPALGLPHRHRGFGRSRRGFGRSRIGLPAS